MPRLHAVTVGSAVVPVVLIIAIVLRIPAPAGAADEPKPDPRSDVSDRITKEQINRIRFMELRASRLRQRSADRVVVTVPKAAINKFLERRQGSPGFQGDAARRQFMRLSPPEKLAEIAFATYDTPDERVFADLVQIKTDPEAMVEFRRRVMPIVLNNCATSACHGRADVSETKMRLYNDPKRSDRTTYGNFVTLREWTVSHEIPTGSGRRDFRLIEPTYPEDSLLLNYMLREDETKLRHPGQSIKPVFQNRAAPGYVLIRDWIASLRQLPVDEGYGFRLLPPMGTATGPAAEADADSAPADPSGDTP